jgi:uncharacterized protein YecA (UPF0149 family)
MAKVGRNSPCPCGSGKKYKRCCEAKEAEMRKGPLPPGRFRYEHGSYGGAGGYMPSILCYKETGPDSWVEHFCLVKPDAVFDEEDSASETAEKHLAEARALMDAGGNIQDFALSLRHGGYKNVSDFRLIRDNEGV